MKKYMTYITNRKQVALGTIEVTLKRPEGFEFEAGQYLQLGLPSLLYSDSAGRSRVFSIASSPLNTKDICVTFRDSGSGFKRTLKALKKNAPVVIEGPYGYFKLSKKSTRPMVFIAGGIGITPFLSMLQFAAAMELEAPITLLYANSSKESAAYLKELQELSKRSASIRIVSTLNRIDEQLLVSNVTDPYDSLWYISGPPAMVDSARNQLMFSEIDEAMICFEEFTGY